VGGKGGLKKKFRVSGCSVPDVVKQKSAFHHTCVSQVKNDFVGKLKAGNLLIQLKFCPAILSHNLRYRV